MQQGDVGSAEKYAEIARDSDPYNAAAFVCLGNICLRRADFNKARDYFLFALDNDAACIEALYNLGLFLHFLLFFIVPFFFFFKHKNGLYIIVFYCIWFLLGLTYRSMGLLEKSMEQFMKLQAVLRHQPEVLFQIASINEEMGNDDQAIEW